MVREERAETAPAQELFADAAALQLDALLEVYWQFRRSPISLLLHPQRRMTPIWITPVTPIESISNPIRFSELFEFTFELVNYWSERWLLIVFDWNGQCLLPSAFRVNMKLEAVDRRHSSQTLCVATVANVIGSRFLVHFDGWDSIYDYWADPSCPYVHPVGWSQEHHMPLTPPCGNHFCSLDQRSDSSLTCKNRSISKGSWILNWIHFSLIIKFIKFWKSYVLTLYPLL